jgi:tol-pal system protein YbgF
VKRVLIFLALGCVPPPARDTSAQLQRQVDNLRAEAEEHQKTLKELENRVFVLEDKLDTAEVARTKSSDAEPRLPVVKKQRPEDPGDKPIAIVSSQVPVGYDPMVPHAVVDDDPPPSPPPVEEQHAVSDDDTTAMTAYKDAYDALQRHDHPAAIQGFSEFLAKYPRHEYADNAQYWLGESYYDQADFKTALVEFRKVIKQFPAGNKVPDALLKIGFCYGKLGDPVASKDVLAQVVQIYGKSDAAKLAQKRLGEMDKP